jgi:nicotinamide mononucleotide adenylyltransferase
MSPHVLIGQELETLEDPETPVSWSVMIQKTLSEMMLDNRITIEEFNHYCGRLNKIVGRRKESSCLPQS